MLISIGTIVGQLRLLRKPFIFALLLGGTFLAAHPLFLGVSSGKTETGVLGGPEGQFGGQSIYEQTALTARMTIGTANGVDIAKEGTNTSKNERDAIAATSLRDTNGSMFNSPIGPGGIFTYKIVRGDTISGIAKKFDTSASTVLEMNTGLKSNRLREGQEIKVALAAQAVAEQGIPPQDESFEIISRAHAGELPRLAGYFKQPAQGLNWGRIHSTNAIDIANSCGAPVISAAEGLVAIDKDFGSGESGWNGGYGKFVLLEHPNGTKTRYAHLDSVVVSVGDYIEQGTKLGTMGNTGNVHGPTGCHLHFEVYGAQNPFVK